MSNHVNIKVVSFLIAIHCLFSVVNADPTERTSDEDYELIVLLKTFPGSLNAETVLNAVAEKAPSVAQQNILRVLHNPTSVKRIVAYREVMPPEMVDRDGETVEEFEQSFIDFPYNGALLHPDSERARMQRSLVLSYPSDKRLQQALETMRHNANVESVVIDKESPFSAASLPNDPFIGLPYTGVSDGHDYQYALEQLNLISAWDFSTGHGYIGIVDSGIDYNHADLKRNYRPQFSYDFQYNDPFPNDTRGHGTMVSGVIAATANNETGGAGACANCSLMVAKRGSRSDIVAGLTFLGEAGAQVANISSEFVGSCDTESRHEFCDSLDLLVAHDVIVVASSGNGTFSADVAFPASDPRIFAIGGVNNQGNLADYPNSYPNNFFNGDEIALETPVDFPNFNIGPELDFMASAEHILTTFLPGKNYVTDMDCTDLYFPPNNDGYGACSGTSFSAPYVSSIATILRSVNPLLSSEDIRVLMALTASNAGSHNNTTGFGIPDTENAIKEALGKGAEGKNQPFQLINRLTPLFSFYSEEAEDSFYTTVPQMASAAIEGTMLPQPSNPVDWIPHYGGAVGMYADFPLRTGQIPLSPLAEVYIFTTEHNPISPEEPLLPLYRLSLQSDVNGNNPSNIDHVYTSSITDRAAHEAEGYVFDGIEGFVFNPNLARPDGAVALYKKYNASRGDHAIFPANKLAAMQADGYTQNNGMENIGYVYTDTDSDNDGVIDGFEIIAGSSISNADTDADGISDGEELLAYPYTNAGSSSVVIIESYAPSYPWNDNESGQLYTNKSWSYNMGYRFESSTSGVIDRLGARVTGNKLVRLYDRSTGQVLASVWVNSNGGWEYEEITPVQIQADKDYVVAVHVAGSGGSSRSWVPGGFPKTFGSITIKGSTYTSWSTMPTNLKTTSMYGMADFHFVPD